VLLEGKVILGAACTASHEKYWLARGCDATHLKRHPQEGGRSDLIDEEGKHLVGNRCLLQHGMQVVSKDQLRIRVFSVIIIATPSSHGPRGNHSWQVLLVQRRSGSRPECESNKQTFIVQETPENVKQL